MRVDVLKVLIYLYGQLIHIFPTVVYHNSLLERTVGYLRLHISLDFEECEHKTEVEGLIFDKFVRFVFTAYMRRASHIIKGKLTPENPESLEQDLYDQYKASCKS